MSHKINISKRSIIIDNGSFNYNSKIKLNTMRIGCSPEILCKETSQIPHYFVVDPITENEFVFFNTPDLVVFNESGKAPNFSFDNSLRYLSIHSLLQTNLFLNENGLNILKEIKNTNERQVIYASLVAFCLGYNVQFIPDEMKNIVQTFLSHLIPVFSNVTFQSYSEFPEFIVVTSIPKIRNQEQRIKPITNILAMIQTGFADK